MVAHCWILLYDSDWEIQFSDSQRNGFGQEQWFSISNSPRGALSFCSSLSLHLVDSIVLFSEQWNGLSSSSVLSGVFVLWNKWTDGSQTSNGSWRLEVCVAVCVYSLAWKSVNVCVCAHFCVWCLRAHACCECVFWRSGTWLNWVLDCEVWQRRGKWRWGWKSGSRKKKKTLGTLAEKMGDIGW